MVFSFLSNILSTHNCRNFSTVSIKYEDENNKSKGYNVVNGNKDLDVGSLEILKGGRGKLAEKKASELRWSETCTNKTIPLLWNSFDCYPLEVNF